MSGGEMDVTPTVEVLLTRLDGKIDLIQQAMDTTKEDMREVRRRLHDVSGEVQKLMALNIQGTLAELRKDVDSTCTRVTLLENEQHMRKGAVALAKVMYTIGGLLGAGGIITVVKVFGGL